MFLSDILKQGVASSTSQVAVVSGSATTNYTPATPVEIVITGRADNASISVNGIPVYNDVAATDGDLIHFSYFVGAGQAQTITSATSGTIGYIISARKVD